MHCMLMDLLHGFEVLSTTEETLFNSRNVSRLVQNMLTMLCIFFFLNMVFLLTCVTFEIECNDLMSLRLFRINKLELGKPNYPISLQAPRAV